MCTTFVQCPWKPAEDIRFPGTGITGQSKPTDVGAGMLRGLVLPVTFSVELLSIIWASVPMVKQCVFSTHSPKLIYKAQDKCGEGPGEMAQ